VSIDPPVSAVSELFAALRAAVGRMLLSWLLSSPTMDPDGEDGLHDVGGRRMQLIMRRNALPHGLAGGSVAAAACCGSEMAICACVAARSPHSTLSRALSHKCG